MARSRTLSSLISDVRLRIDRQNSQYVSDTELTEYINQSITELYDMLVAARGHGYYMKSSTIATVGGTDAYDLPADFYECTGVDALIAGDTVTLRPFMFDERNMFKVAGIWSPALPIYYRLRDAKITFIPTPSGIYTVTLWYIPACPRLNFENPNSFDGINGWEEYVVCDAAAKAKEKEGLDSTALVARLARLTRRIEGLAVQRDVGKPERVTDVEASSARRRWVP